MLFFSFVSMGFFRIYISKWNGSDRIYRVRLTQLPLNLIVSLVFILVSCDFHFICISFCFVRVLNLQYVSLFRMDFLLCECVLCLSVINLNELSLSLVWPNLLGEQKQRSAPADGCVRDRVRVMDCKDFFRFVLKERKIVVSKIIKYKCLVWNKK